MSRMKVYEPAALIEAHLLKGMMRQFGVEAEVHGDTLVGGMGELPAAGLIFISVPNTQTQEAFQILQDYESSASR